jgi:hypothetical protein
LRPLVQGLEFGLQAWVKDLGFRVFRVEGLKLKVQGSEIAGSL